MRRAPRPSLRAPLALAAALLTAGVCFAPTAASAATFPAASPISGEYGYIGPEAIATDANGDSVLAWTTQIEASVGAATQPMGRFNIPTSTLQVSIRSAGGTYGPAASLSTPGAVSGNVAVGMDAAGDASVAWTESTDNNATRSVRVATLRAGSTAFDAPQTVSDPSRTAETPSFAVAPDGSATIAWDYTVSGSLASTQVYAASRNGLGAFGAAVQLSSDPSGAEAPWVAVNPSGQTAVAWDSLDSSIWLERAAPGATLAASGGTKISDAGEAAVFARIALGPSGVVTLGYLRNAGSGDPSQVRARTIQPDGAVSASQLLSPGTTTTYDSFVFAGDATGRTTIALSYQEKNGGPIMLQTATAPPGGTFGTPATIDADATIGDPSLTTGADGSTLLAWRTTAASGEPIQAAIRPGGADAFAAPQSLGTGDGYSGTVAAIATPDIATVVFDSPALADGKYQLLGSSTGSGVAPVKPIATPVSGVPSCVAGSAGPATAGCGPAQAPPTLAAPVLTLGKVTQTGKKPKKGSKKVPPGPKLVSVSVSTTLHATVTATITKTEKGVINGGTKTCVAPPKKKANGKKPKSCTRAVTVGKPVSKTIEPGAASVLTFAKNTPVGNYTLALTGTGASGLPAKSVSASLKVR